MLEQGWVDFTGNLGPLPKGEAAIACRMFDANEEEIIGVFAWNDSTGEIVRHVLDEQGNVRLDGPPVWDGSGQPEPQIMTIREFRPQPWRTVPV